MLHVAHVDLHHEAVVPGYALALHHLAGPLGDLRDLRELPGVRADAEYGAELIPKRARVDLNPVADDHPLVLEPPETVRHRRGGQAHAPAQLRKALAGVLLQLLQELQVCSVWLSIRRRADQLTCDLPWRQRLARVIVSRMAASASDTRLRASVPPHVYFVVSAVFHYLGPAFAVLLFARVHVLGVAWLRIASAAAIFAFWRRPWHTFRRADRDGRRTLLAWGGVLAAMNCCFYLAIDRLPLGTVAAIEFLPVIALAAVGVRTSRNVLALALAVAGVYLVTDLRLQAEPLGLALAFANAGLFAAYIVLADRVAKDPAISGIEGLATSMLVAAVVVTPLGGWAALPAIPHPLELLAGVGVGVSSSVIPYVTDQLALARLPRATYALMVSLLPATATLIGIVILTQIPTAKEAMGVGLVVGGVALHCEG